MNLERGTVVLVELDPTQGPVRIEGFGSVGLATCQRYNESRRKTPSF